MLSDVQLRQIMPNLATAKPLYLPALNQAMQVCVVNTALRTAAFTAQLAHESSEFRRMEEIWGPTDAQRRCEPPNALAAKLGNTEAGDGKRFKGRGPIQITGRFNYAKYGGLLGIDLLADPALPDRQKYDAAAKAVLALGFHAGAVTRDAQGRAARRALIAPLGLARRLADGGRRAGASARRHHRRERARAVRPAGLAGGVALRSVPA